MDNKKIDEHQKDKEMLKRGPNELPTSSKDNPDKNPFVLDKPTVGRIVHYVGYDPPTGTHLAAIITEVYADGIVGLHMFPIPKWAEQIRLQKRMPEEGQVFRGEKGDVEYVKYSDKKEPGTWHWPERT